MEIVSDASLYSVEGIRPHPILEILSAIAGRFDNDNLDDDSNNDADTYFNDDCNRVIEECDKEVSIRCLAGYTQLHTV